MSKSRGALLMLIAFAVTAGACGGGAATEDPAQVGGRFPVEVRGIEIPAEPERIASLSASHTEMLYALGVGERVVATDLFSTYPEEALDTERIDAFNLSVESVAAFDPDLVLLAFDPGEAVEGLTALGIPALLFDAPADLDEAFGQMLEVGVAVGEPERASALVDGLRSEVDALVARVPEGRSFTYFHELDGSLFTITSQTFVGNLYSKVGMVNIADEADEAGSGYPQLSAEYLLQADPDVIVLADTKCCGVTAQTVAARPGWDTLDAVRGGRILELDDDVASRWGPRLVEFLEALVSFLGEEYGA
jgi:iron complex transport system substrate-binding protein